MSCCAAVLTHVKRHCPDCEQRCCKVSRVTLLHQVRWPDNQYIMQGDYFFCANKQCPTVYFSVDQRMGKEQVRAFQPNEQAMLCYCFAISEALYQSALNEGTASQIKHFVMQQTQAAHCACNIRNPSGRCCLVNFKTMEKKHAEED